MTATLRNLPTDKMNANGPNGQGRGSLTDGLPELQATALEVAANPIIISRRDGTIIWVNAAFEALSGYTRKEAFGQNTRLLNSSKQPPSFYKSMWQTILLGQVWRGELVNRRKDGTLYPEEMTITPVINQCGEITTLSPSNWTLLSADARKKSCGPARPTTVRSSSVHLTP